MQSFYPINSNDFFPSMPVLMDPCPFLGWNHICSPDFTLWQSLICETYLDKVKTQEMQTRHFLYSSHNTEPISRWINDLWAFWITIQCKLFIRELDLFDCHVSSLCFLNSFLASNQSFEEGDCLLTPCSNVLVFSFSSAPILNTGNRNGRWAWQLMLNILIGVVGLDSMISQVHRTVSCL